MTTFSNEFSKALANLKIDDYFFLEDYKMQEEDLKDYGFLFATSYEEEDILGEGYYCYEALYKRNDRYYCYTYVGYKRHCFKEIAKEEYNKIMRYCFFLKGKCTEKFYAMIKDKGNVRSAV